MGLSITGWGKPIPIRSEEGRGVEAALKGNVTIKPKARTSEQKAAEARRNASQN